MEETLPSFDIDIEALLNERRTRHQRLMKDLDAVMEVLTSFCNQAEWMMTHDYRIGELIGEVVVASTEVEHILPRTEQYFEEYQRMLLPAVDRRAPKDFDKIIHKVNGVILQLKPYCDKVKEDKEGLKLARKGEIELTGEFNDKFIAYYESVIENFTAAVAKMERHINESHKKHKAISDEIIKMQFDTMFRQYCTIKGEELAEFAEDIEDIAVAKNEFITANQSSDLFGLFQQHEKHPELLVRALKEKDKNETFLLTIFYYKSRMDTLKQLRNAARKEENKEGDNKQPVNLVFKKFHEGRAIDFFTIRMYIEVKLVNYIKYQYEWYAAYRILYDLNLLEEFKLTSFAEQMNQWYPDAKVACDADAFGDYATGHTGKNFSLWDNGKFLAEKKKNQTNKGFWKLWNLCHDIKDALKTIPTLQPRQQ
jgi:hypothetical protein